jgi:hypothetical protein
VAAVEYGISKNKNSFKNTKRDAFEILKNEYPSCKGFDIEKSTMLEP